MITIGAFIEDSAKVGFDNKQIFLIILDQLCTIYKMKNKKFLVGSNKIFVKLFDETGIKTLGCLKSLNFQKLFYYLEKLKRMAVHV